jgi:adenylylsulfate kinase-like enzyme
MVIWVTGLSGSGKTTLCDALWESLKPGLPELVLLDGDAIRVAFGGGLGYQEEDRVVQITRIQQLAKIFSDQDLVVLVAALYSHPDLLTWNRQNIKGYFEVYLETSLKALQTRDYKGLYAKAIAGEMPDVVGIDIPWHTPELPDLVINNDNPLPPEQLADQVIAAVPFLFQSQVAS